MLNFEIIDKTYMRLSWPVEWLVYLIKQCYNTILQVIEVLYIIIEMLIIRAELTFMPFMVILKTLTAKFD